MVDCRTGFVGCRRGCTGLAVAALMILLLAPSNARTTSLGTKDGQESPASKQSPEYLQSYDYYTDARSRFENGDIEAAIVQLKNALQLHPENADARFLLGRAYALTGIGPAAEKELRAAIQLGYDRDPVLAPLAEALLLQQKYREVLSEIHSDTADVEQTTAVQIARGYAHLWLNDLDEAESAFVNADSLETAGGRAKTGLAYVLYARGKLQAAERQADLALAEAPDLAKAHLLKGELRQLAEDPQGALAFFDRALELEPRSFSARLRRASALITLDRDEDALQEIAQVNMRVGRQPMASYLKAKILAKRGEFADAQASLEDLGVFLDQHLASQLLLGFVHLRQDHLEQAEWYLGKVLQAAPAHLQTRKLIGEINLKRDNAKEVFKLLEKPAADGEADAETLNLLGLASMKLGLYAQAEAYFARASSDLPKRSPIYANLALSQFAAGQAHLAVDTLEDVLAADPEVARPAIVLALVHLRSGAYDQAIEVASDLVQRLPGNPIPFNLKGAAHFKKGESSQARESFERALQVQSDFFPAVGNLALLDLEQGNVEGARARYLQFLDSHPSNVDAMLDLAKIAQTQGKPIDVIDWLERAARSDPQALEPRLRLVDAYIGAKQPQRALGVALEAQQIAPRNASVLQTVARAYGTAGNPNQALETYRQLISVLPPSAKAFYGLAQASRAAGDLHGERDALRKAVEIDSDFLSAISALIALETASGNSQEAERLAVAFRDRHPDKPASHTLLGEVYFERGDYSKAAEAYRSGLDLQNNGALAVRYFQARERSSDPATALAWLKSWVEGNPRNIVAREVLAAALLRGRHSDEAIRVLNSLANDQPNNPQTLNNLALAYYSNGDSRALATAESAYQVAPDQEQVADTLGWILINVGELERGLKLLEQAKDGLASSARYKETGQLAEVIYHYAVGLYKSGQYGDAKVYLEKLIDNFYGPFSEITEAQTILNHISAN